MVFLFQSLSFIEIQRCVPIVTNCKNITFIHLYLFSHCYKFDLDMMKLTNCRILGESSHFFISTCVLT